MDHYEFLKEMQAFFCRAMAKGYASGAEAFPIKEMPEWKGYDRHERDWSLVDAYTVNPETKKSVGFTRIWHGKELVWYMSYGGFYDKQAVPCLKAALLHTYQLGQFNGGRGQSGYSYPSASDAKFIYRNVGGGESYFGKFYGEETIYKGPYPVSPGPDRVFGSHIYMGMALV